MSTTTQEPISTTYLQQLIQRALRDLRQARDANEAASITRAERRMNAMLDQLAKRSSNRRFSSSGRSIGADISGTLSLQR